LHRQLAEHIIADCQGLLVLTLRQISAGLTPCIGRSLCGACVVVSIGQTALFPTPARELNSSSGVSKPGELPRRALQAEVETLNPKTLCAPAHMHLGKAVHVVAAMQGLEQISTYQEYGSLGLAPNGQSAMCTTSF